MLLTLLSARAHMATTTLDANDYEDAVYTLQEGFEKVAKQLVEALDARAVLPVMTKDGKSDIATYVVPWKSAPLALMSGAADALGYYDANSLFHDIFQEEAHATLQPPHVRVPDDAFAFALNHGLKWREILK